MLIADQMLDKVIKTNEVANSYLIAKNQGSLSGVNCERVSWQNLILDATAIGTYLVSKDKTDKLRLIWSSNQITQQIFFINSSFQS